VAQIGSSGKKSPLSWGLQFFPLFVSPRRQADSRRGHFGLLGVQKGFFFRRPPATPEVPRVVRTPPPGSGGCQIPRANWTPALRRIGESARSEDSCGAANLPNSLLIRTPYSMITVYSSQLYKLESGNTLASIWLGRSLSTAPALTEFGTEFETRFVNHFFTTCSLN
jgi:hypothetical protein